MRKIKRPCRNLGLLVQAESAQPAGSQSLCIFGIKQSLVKAQKWREIQSFHSPRECTDH